MTAIPQAIEDRVRAQQLSLCLLVRSGSKSYGIDVESSDDDYVGVFVPRLKDLLSISGVERDTYAENDPDFTIHEIGKFCRLALKGNPAILETLWNPDIIVCDAWGRSLIALRSLPDCPDEHLGLGRSTRLHRGRNSRCGRAAGARG